MADDRIFTGEDGKFLADKIIENAEALKKKIDKVDGKGLSTNDYTSEEKTKLAGLSNYDDTALSERVTALESTVEDMSGGASVTVDDALSDTSENPVQNKVISAALGGKADVGDIPAAYDDTALTASVAALTAAVAEKADKSEVEHHVELTQAEYDALSDDEKTDGTVYFIKDGSTVGGVVDQTYDAASSNAQSGTAVAEGVAAHVRKYHYTSARAIYVSTSGDDATGDGSQEKPYRQISAALNSLPSYMAGSATIYVGAGTYERFNVSYGRYVQLVLQGNVTIESASGTSPCVACGMHARLSIVSDDTTTPTRRALVISGGNYGLYANFFSQISISNTINLNFRNLTSICVYATYHSNIYVSPYTFVINNTCTSETYLMFSSTGSYLHFSIASGGSVTLASSGLKASSFIGAGSGGSLYVAGAITVPNSFTYSLRAETGGVIASGATLTDNSTNKFRTATGGRINTGVQS